MLKSKMLTMLSVMTEEKDEIVLSTYLDIAKTKILTHLYPYQTWSLETPLPPQYEVLQVEAAAYFVNKRGAEGEVSHAENGISRTYANADLPADMLRKIVPMCSVLTSSKVEETCDEDYD